MKLNKEMQLALKLDGEKLSRLTGEDHGPYFIKDECGKDQTHCFMCGKKFEQVKFQCPICGEWSCSEECREKHFKHLDAI